MVVHLPVGDSNLHEWISHSLITQTLVKRNRFLPCIQLYFLNSTFDQRRFNLAYEVCSETLSLTMFGNSHLSEFNFIITDGNNHCAGTYFPVFNQYKMEFCGLLFQFLRRKAQSKGCSQQPVAEFDFPAKGCYSTLSLKTTDYLSQHQPLRDRNPVFRLLQ